MANELDEITGQTNADGRDVNVISTQLPVTVGIESVIFEVGLWVALPILFWFLAEQGVIAFNMYLIAAGVLPGIVFWFMKINAQSYLQQLQQKIQADASQIDNYLEQRVIVLNNVVGLLAKAIDLDKDVMKAVTALRSGAKNADDRKRNTTAQKLDGVLSSINVAFEAYPNLQAHAAIADAMEKNSYLQREITAARDLYNDTVAQWNRDIFDWPTKQIVAARNKYTSRIPFTASVETKQAARKTFF